MKSAVIHENVFDALHILDRYHGGQLAFDALVFAFTGKAPDWSDEDHALCGIYDRAVYAAIAPDIAATVADEDDDLCEVALGLLGDALGACPEDDEDAEQDEDDKDPF